MEYRYNSRNLCTFEKRKFTEQLYQTFRYEYDAAGRIISTASSIEKPEGGQSYAKTMYAYDKTGNTVKVLLPEGGEIYREYDAADRDGVQSGAEFSYDLAGNQTAIRSMGGAAQELEYDARGNIIGVADGNQNHTRYELDAWGRITGIVKPDGSTEQYTYDHAGNMTSSTDGEGHTTSYQYDRAGKLTAITDPTGETERYSYDSEGRLAQRIDRNGVITEYDFNLYGAPLSRRVKGSMQGDFYGYTPEGLLKSAISGGMRYSYEYDDMDRLIRKSASGRTLLAMAYDGNGNRIRHTDVTGKVTEYQFNALDLPVKVWDDGSKLAEYEYHADGTIAAERHGPLHKQYQYDLDKNLMSLRVQAGDKVLADNQYRYDGNGNRTWKKQLNGETLYHFDPLNQLVQVEYPRYQEELFYDKAGNRTRRMANGIEELYQYDPRNRLISMTKGGINTPFQYDNAGNLLKDDKALEHFTKVEDVWVNDRGGDQSVQLMEGKEEYKLLVHAERKQYFYNKNGQLICIMDRNRNCIRMRYVNSTLMEILFAGGQHLKLNYEDGRVSGMTDGIGRTIRYRYDGELLTEVEYPNMGIVHYSYTPERRAFTGPPLEKYTQHPKRRKYLYGRYYLLGLSDGSYVAAFADQSYGALHRTGKETVFPIGRLRRTSAQEKALLEKQYDGYAVDTERVLYMMNDDRASDFKFWDLAIRAAAAVLFMGVLAVVVFTYLKFAGVRRK